MEFKVSTWDLFLILAALDPIQKPLKYENDASIFLHIQKKGKVSSTKRRIENHLDCKGGVCFIRCFTAAGQNHSPNDQSRQLRKASVELGHVTVIQGNFVISLKTSTIRVLAFG